MTHGKREQKRFRQHSVSRKAKAQGLDNSRFAAETERLVELYSKRNEKQRPKQTP